MKIAISSTGPTIDDAIDPRFGRCAYFVVVESNDLSFEAFDNESISLGGGAGIQSAQFVASKGVDAVITGNCGPKALQTLLAAKIEVFAGQAGTVREAIEKYRKGDIKSTETPNVAEHYGTGSGADLNRWMKRGCGGGMGMGRGRSSSTWAVPDRSGPTLLSKEEKLYRLKDQVNELRQQIEDLESSMKVLEDN